MGEQLVSRSSGLCGWSSKVQRFRVPDAQLKRLISLSKEPTKTLTLLSDSAKLTIALSLALALLALHHFRMDSRIFSSSSVEPFTKRTSRLIARRSHRTLR